MFSKKKSNYAVHSQIISEDISGSAMLLQKELLYLEGKNILITGASGMIGSYLTYILAFANEHLLKKRVQIYILTRDKKKKFGTKAYLHYIHQDITKKMTLPLMDYLIHAASKAAPKLYNEHMVDTLNTNILGMYSLLDLCNEHTKGFLYVSSAEIYGNVPNKPVDESFIGTVDHTNKRSCYVEAKRASETIALNYFWERGIPINIARIFHTFGPGLNLQDGRIFSDFLRFGLEHNDITISGDPGIKRSMLYVNDAAVMLLKILFSNHHGEIYNVGSEKNFVSVKEFADIVCQKYNDVSSQKIRVVLKKDRNNRYFKHAVKGIRPSLKKFMKEFGYEPRTSLHQAVERTIVYLLENNIS